MPSVSKARKRALLGTICRQPMTLSNTRLAASEMKPVTECQGKIVTSVFTSCSGQIWVSDVKPRRASKPGVGHMVLAESPVQVPGLSQTGCRVWLPPGFLPYLTLLDTSGHGQLIILLQQTYLPLHGEDVELRAGARRGGSGTHQIVDRTPHRPPCPFSFMNEKLRGDMDRKPSVCRKLKGRNPIMVQFRVKSSCTSEYQFKKLGMASAEKFLGMSDYPCPNRSQSRS